MAERTRQPLSVSVASYTSQELSAPENREWQERMVIVGHEQPRFVADIKTGLDVFYGPNEAQAQYGYERKIFVAKHNKDVVGSLTVDVMSPAVTAAGWNGIYNRFKRIDPDYAEAILPIIGNTVFIVGIAAFPEFRGRGIGTALLRQLFEEVDPGIVIGRSKNLHQVAAREKVGRDFARVTFYGPDDITHAAPYRYMNHALFYAQSQVLLYNGPTDPYYPHIMLTEVAEHNDQVPNPAGLTEEIQLASIDLIDCISRQNSQQTGLTGVKGLYSVKPELLVPVPERTMIFPGM